MRFVDDKYFMTALAGGGVHCFLECSYFIDATIGCRIYFYYIETVARVYFLTADAGVAGKRLFHEGLVFSSGVAIDELCNEAGGGCFPASSSAIK